MASMASVLSPSLHPPLTGTRHVTQPDRIFNGCLRCMHNPLTCISTKVAQPLLSSLSRTHTSRSPL